MKKSLLFLMVLFLGFKMQAQLNMDLVGQVPYNTNLSDIWGWADPDDGTEYALVGLGNGVSIVSLADPANPVEVQNIPGQQSTWRDIKTWGDFAYVTTDQSGSTEGLLVIDLTDAPDNITWFNWNPTIAGEVMNTCHNIYIEDGYAYLAGCNNNSGGMIIVDVFTTPGTPVFEALAPPTYSHDVYVRGNLMYSSEIFNGRLGIYDITDKQNITLEATQQTPFDFTHNAWLSDDSNVVFTTDELANAPVAAYDVSNLDNIVELDQFIPIETLGENVIPHNVHVWQDWLIISYYTDGGIVVDASNPTNLIEVGNFDTFFGGNGGFSGAWGAYPFLPSGLVLVTDIGNGLYILEANYVNACWLEGFVTDINTGDPINNAQVIIDSPQANLAFSDLTGEYKTGQAIPGNFEVTVSANGYVPKTIAVDLTNGVITNLDVQLGELQAVNVSGTAVKVGTNTGVANAFVRIFNDSDLYETTADANGVFSFPAVFEGTYTVVAAQWGCFHATQTVTFTGDSDVIIDMETGYQDDFFADWGWTSENLGASTGDWERGIPDGTTSQGNQSNPGEDVPDDIGERCFVTGNDGGGAGNDDVDNGSVRLTSPVMDLSGYNEPLLSYRTWFFNAGGQGTPDDQMEIRVSNGTDEVLLETISDSESEWNETVEFNLIDYISLTDNMQVIFETGDLNVQHLVEAAVDAFLIEDTALYPPFIVSTTQGCIPSTIDFMDQSDSTASYAWTFEGGTPATSSISNPSVTYATAGVYDVILEVTTDDGNMYVVNRPNFIQILPTPTAAFTANVTGNTVNITNDSSNGTTYEWNFGDNETSTAVNPAHIYDEAGTYTITLITTNDCGSNTTTQEIEVTSVPPNAGFDISSLEGCVPFEVTFSDQSTGNPSTWQWSIPGSDNENATIQNPTVTYNTPGTYSVSLMVTNAAGTSMISQTQVIEVGAVPTVDFDFVIDDATVNFSNFSDDATSYVWNFGDMNESNDTNPSHTYTASGEYTVTLTAINDCGQIAFAKNVIVVISTVEEIAQSLDFQVFPNPFEKQLTVKYSASEILNAAQLKVYNVLGQLVEQRLINGRSGTIAVGGDWQAGIYFVKLEMENRVLANEKIVKVQ